MSIARKILLAGLVTTALAACNGDQPTPMSELPLDSSVAEATVVAFEPTERFTSQDQPSDPELCSAKLTPSNPEGPFYTPGAPERSNLIEPGMSGTPLLLTGRVMTVKCEPLSGTLLDFWQTDTFGVYDNEGFGLRGKLFADENGEFRLKTLLPGLYPGRPAHIHVKVTAPGGSEHTTQIYFPGTQFGGADELVDPTLIATLVEPSDGSFLAKFDFVIAP